ncbi:HAMP domain-containing histidine kinase [Crocinitomicaceae bacterium]|nr:HAMP domain-containing histidine kinase [Crocinitomicaceae bacterium]
MKTLTYKYCFNASDSGDIKFAKSLILIISICCSFCGLVWSGIYYFFFGFGLTTLLPLIFVVIVISSIFISHFTSNYKILVYAQLACITWVTGFIQWSLGSIHDSGFVIAWCFLGPIGALLFLNEKEARIWMVMFILILGITSIGVPTFSMDGLKVTENARTIFYLMNIGVPFAVIFYATAYFMKDLIKQKERNFSLLQITNEKNEEIEKSLKREKELGILKTNFVSMVSHEFRTPLATINANSDIILRYSDELSRDDINKRLGKIKSEVLDMTVMLEDILIIGKSDAQKLDFNPVSLDIVSLIKDIIAEYQLSEPKSRTIIFNVSTPIIMIPADKKWIKHIVNNLLSNAIKYSGEDQQIEISIKKEPTGISFSFKDYGVGISKEDIAMLFEPFYRGENVGEISGAGLGLVILQKALNLHNGKIEVESEIGKGSNFRVTLPAV